MTGINKVIMLACVITLSLTINIAPWLEDRTIAECTQYFSVSADYQYAVCGKSDGTYAYKWNSGAGNYDVGTLITSNIVHDIQLTSDGKFLAIRITEGSNIKLQVYCRDNGDANFVSKFSSIVANYNYYLTDNHQHLVYSTSSNVVYAIVNGNNGFDFTQNIPCNNCDAAISEDGTVIVTSHINNGIAIYKKTGGTFNSFTTSPQRFKARTLSTYITDPANFYIVGARYNGKQNMVLKFDGSITVSVVNSNLLQGSNGDNVKAEQTAISPDSKWFAFGH